MTATERTYRIRRTIRHYNEKQLHRLHFRIWEHIEKWYGTGAWDWPTLYVVYPQLACVLKAVDAELKARRQI